MPPGDVKQSYVKSCEYLCLHRNFLVTEHVMVQHNFGVYHVVQLKILFFVWLLFFFFFVITFAVEHTHFTSFLYFPTLYNYNLQCSAELSKLKRPSCNKSDFEPRNVSSSVHIGFLALVTFDLRHTEHRDLGLFCDSRCGEASSALQLGYVEGPYRFGGALPLAQAESDNALYRFLYACCVVRVPLHTRAFTRAQTVYSFIGVLCVVAAFVSLVTLYFATQLLGSGHSREDCNEEAIFFTAFSEAGQSPLRRRWWAETRAMNRSKRPCRSHALYMACVRTQVVQF